MAKRRQHCPLLLCPIPLIVPTHHVLAIAGVLGDLLARKEYGGSGKMLQHTDRVCVWRTKRGHAHSDCASGGCASMCIQSTLPRASLRELPSPLLASICNNANRDAV